MNRHRDQFRQLQREALWKWRWLGFRNSTPAFKGSVVILVVAAISIAGRTAL
jgi:hypothetical protein